MIVVFTSLSAVAITVSDGMNRRAIANHCHTKTVTKIVKDEPVATAVKVCGPSSAHGYSSGAETSAQSPQEFETSEPSSCEYWANEYDLAIGDDFQCGDHILLEGDEETAAPQLTPGLIRQAVDSFEIPAPEMVIQPPDGETLVNFDTNFYTESEVLRRSTTLLGQSIEFRIIPQSYTWRFGDGSARTTQTPGAPYPALDVTHRYLQKGTFQPQLTTTYTAEYRVNGGGWATVPGELTVADAPQSLEATTASPVLVAPDGN
ncbi:hypothetical protein KUV85_06865 [Nocardioides panacisoli]|uniref:PKD domain-containing protein n=1 Tax=Nocardioides panacisoli TaxID=627624 RepID=UPI001C62FDBF|nr:hypothetical protein [Nocardioides panacisoli]QYJ05395.1 hypothetical protein KUV85_06865 [Nocardioides panacisoli]